SNFQLPTPNSQLPTPPDAQPPPTGVQLTPMPTSKITTPDDPALADLCTELRARADATDASGDWPAEQLRLCGEAGVFEWFLEGEWGGQGWSDQDVVRGYLALSAACLTTTFIITQRTGACRRIASGSNDELKRRLLPG